MRTIAIAIILTIVIFVSLGILKTGTTLVEKQTTERNQLIELISK